MMKYLISVYLLLIPLMLQGQKVHKVKYESQADLKIYIVKYESQTGWKNPEKQHLLF